MLQVIRGAVRKSNRYAQIIAKAHAEGNMICKVTIRRGGTGTPSWDPNTHRLVMPNAQVLWAPDPNDAEAGIARIGPISGPVTLTLGDEPQYFQSGFISIPARAPLPNVDDVVEVNEAPDAKLIGRFYRVVDIERGSQLPIGHRMQVAGIEPGRTWRGP